MPIEDVVFLGAGASTAKGAPLQGDLFKEYFSCKTHESHPTYPELKSFFKKFFGVDGGNLGSKLFPTFEEVLGILEIALNREEGFRDCDKRRIQQIREDLIFLIATVIDEKLRGVGREYHTRLVQRLKEEDRLSKTGFVSLNYDILIDNALVALHQLPGDYDLDYGIEFTNFERNGDWERPSSKKAIYLYKLHGSLNWLYCPTCISLTLTPKEKSAARLVFKPEKCDVCKSKMIPIIIPPTFFKVMSNFYLQELWHKAEDMLKQAKRIFFCGYSFPDADIHIKYLLKRVEINGGGTPEVFIFNKPETSGEPGKEIDKRKDEIRQEKDRYKRFFKNSKKIDYTNKSFQDFCRDGVDNKSKRV